MKPSRATHRIRQILLLAGSFAFAFLLGEAVHEWGHYLAHRAYGHAAVRVHLDSFGGSRIVGVTALPVGAMGVTTAAGPLLNLALGLTAALLLWRARARHPGLLSLALWGPVAMVQEGVTFSLGLLTPGGDASWIAAWGVPVYVVLGAGILLLLAGVAATSWRLLFSVLAPGDPFWVRVLVVTAGISLLMLVRAIHALLAAPALVIENLVPMAFSLLLAVVVVELHGPWIAWRLAPAEPARVPWPAAASAMALGVGLFLIQIVVPPLL